MKLNVFVIIGILVLSLVSCKKNDERPQAKDYMTWKVDGVTYEADTSIEYPAATYYTNTTPTPLSILAYTQTLSVHINLLDEPSYLGTFDFGDKDSDNHEHYARISYGPNGKPVDYNNDSWFANGLEDTNGMITITGYDTTNHRIEGTFEGKFYNFNDGTYKTVTEGTFSLPLSINNN